MVAAIGSLLVKFKSIGFANIIGKTAKFKTQFGSMAKNVKPQVEGLTKAFGKFGAIVSGVMIGLIAASPRLQAEFEILAIRVEQFLRPFGDELAPAIRIVSDLIDTLTGVFQGLPQPIQDAATFGVGFVITLGLIAGAIVTLGLLINPFTIILAGLAVAAGALKLAFDTNFLGIQDIVTGVVDNIVTTLEKIVTTVGALLSGDLEGFLTGLADLFFGVMTSIWDFIMLIPNAFIQIIDDLTGGLATRFITAGQEIVEAFITAIGQAIIDGSAAIGGWLDDYVFVWFGGSLPEKGPLMHMIPAGEELGEAYVMAIGSGIASQTTRNSTSMNIQNVNIGMREEQFDTERSFFDGLNTGIRKGTSF